MAVVQSAGQLTTITEAYWPSVPRSLRLTDGMTSDYAAIWRTQPAVRTVTGFLARNIGQIGLHVYRRESEQDRRRLRPADHPVAAALHRPVPGRPVTPFRMIEAAVYDLTIYYNTILVKVAAGDRLALVRIPWELVEPLGGALWPEQYRVSTARGNVTLDRDQVVHVRGYNPHHDRFGTSPMEALRMLLLEEDAAGRYRERFWRNGALVEGVIERPREAPKWSDTARNRFKNDWHGRFAGAGVEVAGTPILEEGMSYKPLSTTWKDAQWIEARKLTREESASAYWVHPAMIGILEHANFANIREQHRMTYTDTLGPWLQMLQQDLMVQLEDDYPDLADGTVYVEFNIAEKLRGDFEQQAQQLQSATGAPYLTRNEARARINLPSVDGGDDLVVPLNVLVGGQASPTDAGDQNLRALQGRTGTKALAETTSGYVAVHRNRLAEFFARQRQSVMSALGGGAPLSAAWDGQRWNGELGADLTGAAFLTAQAAGEEVLEYLPADWSAETDLAEFLASSSNAMAVEINAWTLAHLQDAVAGQVDAFTSDATELELEAAAAVFAGLIDDRAGVYAMSRTVTVWNAGRAGAAAAAGAGSKRWVTTSRSPRSTHSAMAGETVAIGERFSNGALWPGDPALPVDQRANCQCTFDVLV